MKPSDTIRINDLIARARREAEDADALSSVHDVTATRFKNAILTLADAVQVIAKMDAAPEDALHDRLATFVGSRRCLIETLDATPALEAAHQELDSLEALLHEQ